MMLTISTLIFLSLFTYSELNYLSEDAGVVVRHSAHDRQIALVKRDVDVLKDYKAKVAEFGQLQFESMMATTLRNATKLVGVQALQYIENNMNLNTRLDFEIDKVRVLKTNGFLDPTIILQFCAFDVYPIDPTCQLGQCPNDDGDWTLFSGPSPVPNTGPTSDRSGPGRYMMLNSLTTYQGSKLELVLTLNTVIDQPVTYCLTFWFSMLGADIGSLAVENILYQRKLVWLASKEGASGFPGWKKAAIPVPATTFSMSFIATMGNGIRSDIGIDEIILRGEMCTSLELRMNANYYQVRESELYTDPASITSTTTSSTTTTTTNASTTGTQTQQSANTSSVLPVGRRMGTSVDKDTKRIKSIKNLAIALRFTLYLVLSAVILAMTLKL